MIIAALCGGKPAGFIPVWEPDRYIHSLFARRGSRGLGIGSRLLEEAPMRCLCVGMKAAEQIVAEKGEQDGRKTDDEKHRAFSALPI